MLYVVVYETNAKITGADGEEANERHSLTVDARNAEHAATYAPASAVGVAVASDEETREEGFSWPSLTRPGEPLGTRGDREVARPYEDPRETTSADPREGN